MQYLQRSLSGSPLVSRAAAIPGFGDFGRASVGIDLASAGLRRRSGDPCFEHCRSRPDSFCRIAARRQRSRWVCRRPMSVVRRRRSFGVPSQMRCATPASANLSVTTVLSPAWSSDWITGRGPAQAAKLRHRAARASGIKHARCAALASAGGLSALPLDSTPKCISEFGSTPCKALHRCRACLEPFEYFKCI